MLGKLQGSSKVSPRYRTRQTFIASSANKAQMRSIWSPINSGSEHQILSRTCPLHQYYYEQHGCIAQAEVFFKRRCKEPTLTKCLALLLLDTASKGPVTSNSRVVNLLVNSYIATELVKKRLGRSVHRLEVTKCSVSPAVSQADPD